MSTWDEPTCAFPANCDRGSVARDRGALVFGQGAQLVTFSAWVADEEASNHGAPKASSGTKENACC
jgi:hypothetical protein